MIIKELSEKTRKELRDYFKDRDYMVVTVPADEPVRVYVVKATRTVEIARRIHTLSPASAVALGRTIVGSLLLTSLVKHATDQKILLKIEGNGPAGAIVSEADGKGRTRGFIANRAAETFVKEEKEKKKMDISRVVGKEGTLTVVKELRMGTPYTSVVPLVSGEIAEDIAFYLMQSEQIPSAVGIGVLIEETGKIKHAGGFLIQTLGGTSKKAVDLIEDKVMKIPPITELMSEGNRPEDIALLLLENLKPKLVSLKEVEYYCPCDEEIAKSSLLTLSKEEIEEIVSEGPAEVICNFCGRIYRFAKEELNFHK